MINEFAPEGTPHFKQYGKSFQEKIFQCLITDRNWSTQMSEVMTPTYFDLKYLRYLSDKYFSYYLKYKDFPTLPLLITIVRDDLREGKDVILRDQIVEFLHRIRMNPDIGDLKFVKEKTLDFCKQQAMKEALEEAVERISDGKLESVMDLMRHALSVGMPASIGHDFMEDAEARFVHISRCACPTGIPQLDKKDILNGGLGRGEIGVVTANTGVGKSLRYDSNFCDIPSNEVIDRKDEVLKKYEEMDLGRLIIKEYPTGSATVMMIRNHMEKLSLKGFVPSLIVIDYADIMRSSRKYDSLRHELKLIYEELRNLAMDMNIPVWTASQANRDSANSDIVGLENMSEAYGKAMVADVVVSLSRKPTEKSSGLGRIFIAKNRAGRDGVLFPMKMDTARSKILVVDSDDEMTLSEALKSDNNDMKTILKNKWKEINSNS